MQIRRVPDMIRVAVSADADAIERILKESPEAAQWLAAEVRAHSVPGISVWVAQEADVVAGVVAARGVAGEGEILDLAVAPEWRRRGVGRSLLEFAIARLAEALSTAIFLEVRESNAAAREFYRHMNFCESGRRRNYYRDPVEDGLVFTFRPKLK